MKLLGIRPIRLSWTYLIKKAFTMRLHLNNYREPTMNHSLRILCLITLFSFSGTAFTNDVKVKRLISGQQPAEATLEDIVWMQGDWKGEFPNTGQFNEHIVASPKFKQLPSIVRFYSDHIMMNEIAVFIERNGSLDYVVRHFQNGLIALEPVDKPLVRHLISIEGNRYYFEGITFVNDSPDQHTVYYEYPEGERKGEILTLIQKRQ